VVEAIQKKKSVWDLFYFSLNHLVITILVMSVFFGWSVWLFV